VGWNIKAIEKAFADATVDPRRWREAMDVASNVTGSAGAVLLQISDRLPFVPYGKDQAASFESYIKDGLFHRDERYRCAPILASRGAATDLNFISAERMKNHPYYQEPPAPHNLQWFAGVRIAAGDDLWCLSIQRSASQGPFSSQEKKLLAELSPRLSGSAALSRALGFVAASALLEAFELSETALVLLNRAGEAFRLNCHAKKVIDSDIRIIKKRLVSYKPDATNQLDRAIHELIWKNDGSAIMPPVRLPRNTRQSVLAYPLKVSSVSAHVFSESQAQLVLVDPEKRYRPPEAALQAAFDLTAAEGRLASRIASGEPLEAASGVLKIAKQTARNHLKVIFAKTGVSRQAELVALAANLF
jgi:DNA-binding CsgD family transcriptional regulator